MHKPGCGAVNLTVDAVGDIMSGLPIGELASAKPKIQLRWLKLADRWLSWVHVHPKIFCAASTRRKHWSCYASKYCDLGVFGLDANVFVL